MRFEPINVNQYPDAGKKELIPNGLYKMAAIEAEVCQSKSGQGQYIKITWKIIEGQYNNRQIIDNVNIRNTNPEAERIGRSQLASILMAMGMAECGDTDLLLNRPIMAKVGVRKDKSGQFDDQNNIVSYSPASKNGPVMPPIQPQAAPTAPVAAPAAQPVAPWLQGQVK